MAAAGVNTFLDHVFLRWQDSDAETVIYDEGDIALVQAVQRDPSNDKTEVSPGQARPVITTLCADRDFDPTDKVIYVIPYRHF